MSFNKETVEAMSHEIGALWKAKKFSEIAEKFYTENAIGIYPESGKVVGRAALAKCWEDTEKAIPIDAPEEKWTIECACQVNDDNALSRTFFEQGTHQMWVVFVWKKIGGKWLAEQEYCVY